MRVVILFLLIALPIGAFAGSGSLRRVDFKNFTYPWGPYSGWPDHLEWLRASPSEQVQLVDGVWRDDSVDDSRDVDTKTDVQSPFTGLTFESVEFGDATGDGREDAIVVLRFDTGGTQYSHYVFIFSPNHDKPKLLANFHSGDRSASGLYRVYPQSGKLVVELFDPRKATGDCCSTGFVRTRYWWRNGKFEASGPNEFGTAAEPSRIPVSVFGNH